MFAILLCFVSVLALLSWMNARPSGVTLAAFALGIVTPLLVKTIARQILNRRSTKKDRIYGLEHGILNITLPPSSMWMNLGFWKNTPGSFAGACSALLEEVLLTAGVAERRGQRLVLCNDINIVDVGFGCGDQSLYLHHLSHGPHRMSYSSAALQADGSIETRRQQGKVAQYVGITANKRQCDFATQRFVDTIYFPETHDKYQGDDSTFKLFCADAASPQNWLPDLKHALENIYYCSDRECETWLLGLDSMYHFSPSREPLFQYARQELQASIMAFDLFLSGDEPLGVFDRLILRLFCAATSTPYGNLMSKTQYRNLLLNFGYQDVIVKDISEHVFGPLAAYLKDQDARLQSLGKGIGAFRVACWVFSRWARSGAVRGCIVVARHPPIPQSSRSSSEIRD